jgi:hypothetical protein
MNQPAQVDAPSPDQPSPYICKVRVDTTGMGEKERTSTIQLLHHTIGCPITYISGSMLVEVDLTLKTVAYTPDITAAFLRGGGKILKQEKSHRS